MVSTGGRVIRVRRVTRAYGVIGGVDGEVRDANGQGRIDRGGVPIVGAFGRVPPGCALYRAVELIEMGELCQSVHVEISEFLDLGSVRFGERLHRGCIRLLVSYLATWQAGP